MKIMGKYAMTNAYYYHKYLNLINTHEHNRLKPQHFCVFFFFVFVF